MSLILEALKKLDREKQAPDRGLVVVGPSAWPSPRDSRFPMSAALVVAALAFGGTAGAIWLLRRPAAPSVDRPSLAAPVPATPARSRPALEPTPVPVTATKSRLAPAAEPAVAPAASGETAPRAAAPTAEAAPSKAPPRAAAADFQLQAISAQNGQPVAVLNDRLVREGDTFDGVRVVRIGAEEVEIEVAGRRRVIKF